MNWHRGLLLSAVLLLPLATGFAALQPKFSSPASESMLSWTAAGSTPTPTATILPALPTVPGRPWNQVQTSWSSPTPTPTSKSSSAPGGAEPSTHTPTDIFVSSFTDGSIRRVNSESGDTQLVTILGFPASDMVVDANGILYVGGVTNGVKRIDTNTNPATILSDVGTNICGPEGLSMDTAGNVYANTRKDPCDHSGVWRIDGGTAETAIQVVPPFTYWGVGTAFLTEPPYEGHLIAAAADGSIWGDKIVRSSPQDLANNNPPSTFIGGLFHLVLPIGIAVSSAGEVFVADRYDNLIRRYAPDGTFLGTFASGFAPRLIEFDTEDNLYVTEEGTNNLLKFAPDGTSTVLTNVPGITGVAVAPSPVAELLSLMASPLRIQEKEWYSVTAVTTNPNPGECLALAIVEEPEYIALYLAEPPAPPRERHANQVMLPCQTSEYSGSLTYQFLIMHDWDWIEPWHSGLLTRFVSLLNSVLLHSPGIGAALIPGGIMTLHYAVQETRYTYTVTPANQSDIPPVTVTVVIPEFKQFLLDGYVAGTVACYLASPFFALVGPAGWIIGGACWLAQQGLYMAAYDPDADYAGVVNPQPIHLPQMDQIPAGIARDTAQAYLDYLSLDRALRDSLARYEGALAAGDGDWAYAHLNAAIRYSESASQQLQELSALQDELLTPMGTLTQEQIEAFQADIRQNGFPAEFVNILSTLGFTGEDITSLEDSLPQVDPALGADPADLTALDTDIVISLVDTSSGLAQELPAASPPDGDVDTIPDQIDNCPTVYNLDQADFDSDALGDVCDPCPHDPDCDGDGCGDGEEAAMGFDPLAWYDFFDVKVPVKADADGANRPKNGMVDINDALAVLFYFGANKGGPENGNGVSYDAVKGVDIDGDSTNDIALDPDIPEGLIYDRSPGSGLTAGPPNDYIDINDALIALKQFGLSCSGAP